MRDGVRAATQKGRASALVPAAERLFTETRDGFVRQGIGYDAARREAVTAEMVREVAALSRGGSREAGVAVPVNPSGFAAGPSPQPSPSLLPAAGRGSAC